MTTKFLSGVALLAAAAGSQLGAVLALAVPAAMWWPSAAPPAHAGVTTALLAVFCTGVAYLLYFRPIAHVGLANAISVTFLIPAFAVLRGWHFWTNAPMPQWPRAARCSCSAPARRPAC